mmetsp:Transcript_36311/g.73861  ORF Transcript_36311/g.73861 Transcript_36311/m.73861 type:complete len:324 (+) Transcript_36311:3560-4531(+)
MRVSFSLTSSGSMKARSKALASSLRRFACVCRRAHSAAAHPVKAFVYISRCSRSFFQNSALALSPDDRSFSVRVMAITFSSSARSSSIALGLLAVGSSSFFSPPIRVSIGPGAGASCGGACFFRSVRWLFSPRFLPFFLFRFDCFLPLAGTVDAVEKIEGGGGGSLALAMAWVVPAAVGWASSPAFGRGSFVSSLTLVFVQVWDRVEVAAVLAKRSFLAFFFVVALLPSPLFLIGSVLHFLVSTLSSAFSFDDCCFRPGLLPPDLIFPTLSSTACTARTASDAMAAATPDVTGDEGNSSSGPSTSVVTILGRRYCSSDAFVTA